MISCPASKNVGLPVKVGRKNGIARLQRIRMKRRSAIENELRVRQRELVVTKKHIVLKHRRAKMATLQTQPYYQTTRSVDDSEGSLRLSVRCVIVLISVAEN